MEIKLSDKGRSSEVKFSMADPSFNASLSKVNSRLRVHYSPGSRRLMCALDESGMCSCRHYLVLAQLRGSLQTKKAWTAESCSRDLHISPSSHIGRWPKMRGFSGEIQACNR